MTLQLSRRLLLIVVALALTGTVVAALQPHQSVRIEVDLSASTLEVRDGGELVSSFVISGGKDAHPTPRGEFKVRRMIWNPSWTPPPNAEWARGSKARKPGDPDNPMKVVKIFFKQPDYYIHGTDELNKLGQPASHGCIRMAPDDVEQLGKLLMEQAGQYKPDPWYKRVFRSRKERAVNLKTPIPMVVVG